MRSVGFIGLVTSGCGNECTLTTKYIKLTSFIMEEVSVVNYLNVK